jgi:putative DNA primase/helicase
LLAAWQPPPEAKHITIFGDNDENHAGQVAAHTLANRLILDAQRTKIERVVTVEIPSGVKDWNDVLMQRSK